MTRMGAKNPAIIMGNAWMVNVYVMMGTILKTVALKILMISILLEY